MARKTHAELFLVTEQVAKRVACACGYPVLLPQLTFDEEGPGWAAAVGPADGEVWPACTLISEPLRPQQAAIRRDGGEIVGNRLVPERQASPIRARTFH